MKPRRLVIFVVSAVAFAAVACVLLSNYWGRKQPVFKDAPKLVAAMQAYSRDLAARGRVLPDSVSLRELVNGGYLAPADVRAFDGMEVTVWLTATEAIPGTRLARVRMADGEVYDLLADGSVRGVRK